MSKDIQVPSSGDKLLLGVVEQMLVELCRDTEPGFRPDKQALLEMLSSGQQKLNLYFIKHLPREAVTALRRDGAWRDKLYASLRQTIAGTPPPLLNPERVRHLIPEASGWPMADVRRDPDLWAARIIASLPMRPQGPLPLVSLRGLIAGIKSPLEKAIPVINSIEQLDALYLFIERELDSTPRFDSIASRTQELLDQGTEDPGEVIAAYRLLAMRIPDTLEAMEPSAEKDNMLVAVKELAGFMSPTELRLEYKKRMMARADELMKNAGNFDQLLELRFFFDQIGERSNRRLLSRRTGELARGMNVRAEGYELLGKLDMEELDEDGLLELVPAVMGKAESFILGAPHRFLQRLMKFYLETACPLLRSLRSKPERVPRLIQNFKRQVGLLNNFDGLDDITMTIQRKMVLAICGPQMLADAPDRILSWLTRLPPEFYPPEVMKVIRNMVREKGSEYSFTPGDVLQIFSAYPPVEEEEEEEMTVSTAEEIERLIRFKQGKLPKKTNGQ
jgi:hypothetical protein